VDDDAPRELVSEVEGLHGFALLELVQAVPDTADGRIEALDELPARAVVVAVGQEDLLGWAVLGEPVEPVGRRDRVDQRSFRREVVRMDTDLDARMGRGPVPDARSDLVHGGERSAERAANVCFTFADDRCGA
jgi:hypothetical protein